MTTIAADSDKPVFSVCQPDPVVQQRPSSATAVSGYVPELVPSESV
jgi:hypothetical protein